jgi:hypothetical protein
MGMLPSGTFIHCVKNIIIKNVRLLLPYIKIALIYKKRAYEVKEKAKINVVIICAFGLLLSNTCFGQHPTYPESLSSEAGFLKLLRTQAMIQLQNRFLVRINSVLELILGRG